MSAEGYDETKDSQLWEQQQVFADQFNRLDVAIYQYGDKGKPKLQISRQKWDKKQDKWIFAKLGRMSQQEFEAVSLGAQEGFAAIRGDAGKVPAGFAEQAAQQPITDDDIPF